MSATGPSTAPVAPLRAPSILPPPATPPDVEWVALVPLKGLRDAKSRLREVGDVRRRELAVAMACDTVAACVAALGPGHVWVVTSDPVLADRMARLGAHPTDDPGTGLNDALQVAADRARAVAARQGRLVGLAAVVGDLPCLTAADLRATLATAGRSRRAYVPDTDGTGTVLLTARPGVSLEPRFGVDSAARHAQVADVLDAPPGVRLDVDDIRAWQRARTTGPGPHTLAVAGEGDAP